MLVERALSRAGFNATMRAVPDGEEAMAYLLEVGQFANRQAFPLPDVLLLDLKMPRKDGFEVLEWLGQQKQFEEMQVITMSAFDAPAIKEAAMSLGAKGYLLKRSDADSLALMLRHLLPYHTKTLEDGFGNT